MTLMASHDPSTVVLSYVIAVLASYAALDLAGRVSEERGRSQRAWLVGGAFAMGLGIWSMHYTGMAAARFVAAVSAPPRFALDVSALGAGAIGITTVLVLAIALIAAYKEHLQRQQRQLERERGFSERLVADVPAAIAFLDRDMVFRWANPAYYRMTGIPAAGLLGRTVAQAFGPAGEAQIGAMLRQVVDTGQPYHSEGFPFRYVLNGRERSTYWDFTYSPMIDEGTPGRPIDGVLILAVEVSERVERERLKDQFLSVLSHELRTPINAIMGFGSVLEDGLAGPLTPAQASYLGKMRGATDTLLALIDDLLDMSRIQAGKFAIAPQPMDFAAKAREVVEALAPAAAGKAQRVTLELPPTLPLVADELRVGQVLSNLVGNALKFGPSATAVRVSARMVGGRLRCEVTDDGEGIPADVLPRLFQPFSQADMSATRRQGGMGLGLSIAKALVEAHGGTIGVLSQPGRGSTFWFELPGTAAAGSAARDPGAGESATRRTDGGASYAV